MKNVSVKIKMLSVAFMTIMGMIIICIFTMTKTTQMQKNAEETLHKSIEEDYDENIKNQVENAISLLDAVYQSSGRKDPYSAAIINSYFYFKRL